jgi:hypothetical protein
VETPPGRVQAWRRTASLDGGLALGLNFHVVPSRLQLRQLLARFSLLRLTALVRRPPPLTPDPPR